MAKTTPQKNTEVAAPQGRIFKGIVVSDKMKDTIVVKVDTFTKHPKYHKFMTRRTKILAHDPGNTKKIGDKATVEACRPISKRKAFKIIA